MAQPPDVDGGRPSAYPDNRVIGIIDRTEDLQAAVAALDQAGVSHDDVEVLCGPDGLARLDADGHFVAAVEIDGDEDKERVRAILATHDAHDLHFFGKWSVEQLPS